MIGLLFVAASVASNRFRGSRSAALRMFLSASVVHFGSILGVSLILAAPLRLWTVCGGFVVAAGVFGVGYYGLTWRDAMTDGLSRRIDREDTIWYAILPLLAYVLEAACGIGLALRLAAALPALALTVGILLIVALHNAWDITIWSISRADD
ncbi:MAG TPA: hypothetical protein VHB27_01240 [Rhodopila sp.]|uniref:hypothetical protein n=1 Tax=Rhodopila sp. TaxID=2480087 RepID=UPI002C28C509|nr:hypothetical protein [Rhodopila sp.]HVY13821.1 hypothetical protein [Rhodopila sp.]